MLRPMASTPDAMATVYNGTLHMWRRCPGDKSSRISLLRSGCAGCRKRRLIGRGPSCGWLSTRRRGCRGRCRCCARAASYRPSAACTKHSAHGNCPVQQPFTFLLAAAVADVRCSRTAHLHTVSVAADGQCHCRSLGVSAEASRVLQIWARLEDPYAAPSAPDTGPAPAYRPPSTLAFSGRPEAAVPPQAPHHTERAVRLPAAVPAKAQVRQMSDCAAETVPCSRAFAMLTEDFHLLALPVRVCR